MLRAGQSLPPKGLSTLRFDAGRFPPTPAACYRASWQLPGPDSHRLADTSLRVDYLNAITSKGDITSRTHAAGLTKSALAEQAVDTLARINEGPAGMRPTSYLRSGPTSIPPRTPCAGAEHRPLPRR